MSVTARLRRLYGASPLHLLALTASLLISGAAIVGWFQAFQTPDTIRILVWFLGAAVSHDLILLPLYSLLDRIAFGALHGSRPTEPAHGPGWVYVRIPALLSGLVWLVFFPEALRLGDSTFHTASGLTQHAYLARLLLTCGALFALSGIAYAVSLARLRLRPDTAVR